MAVASTFGMMNNGQALSLMVKKARHQIEQNIIAKKPGRAFAHFLIVYTLDRGSQSEMELWNLFLATLCSWGISLEKQKRYCDLLQCYNQALEIFPENEELLNNLGTHALRLNDTKSAFEFYQRALTKKPDFLAAERNLKHVCHSVVDRWHFKMLNDTKRNEAFRLAITKRVQQEHNTVLDIGTGTGILSLFAVEAGAKTVFACDSSSTMVEIAKEVFAANNANVQLIHKPSYDLTIPEHLPERVSLVVSETFDAGGFGENILQTLAHAWDNLLLPLPHGTVIPQGISLWLAGIQCGYLSRCTTAKWSSTNLISSSQEPYDSEDLNQIPGGYSFLTQPCPGLEVNLNDRQNIEQCLAGETISQLTLLCHKSGQLDAIAVWFCLTLDGEVMISTRPDEGTCWEQAIFTIPPRQVNIGQEVRLEMSCKTGRLDIRDCDEPVQDAKIVTKEIIRSINNTKLLNVFNEIQEDFKCIKLDHILDLSAISVLGAQLLTCPSRQLVCLDQSLTAADKVTQIDIDSLESDTRLFDVIITDLISTSGELKEDQVNRLPMLKLMLSPIGVILPLKVTLCCVLTSSKWLNRVSEMRPDRHGIADRINRYQSDLQLDLNICALEHTPLSSVFTLLDLRTAESTTEMIEKNVFVEISQSGSLNALLYWFESVWRQESVPISTHDALSHINQAAILVRPQVEAKQGSKVSVKVRYQMGIVALQVQQDVDLTFKL